MIKKEDIILFACLLSLLIASLQTILYFAELSIVNQLILASFTLIIVGGVNSNIVDRNILIIVCLFILLNISSHFKFLIKDNVSLNISWIFQGFVLFPLIFSTNYLVRDEHILTKITNYSRKILYVILGIGIVGIAFGFYHLGLSWLSSGYDQNLTYEFVAHTGIGVSKQIFPFALGIFYLLSASYRKKNKFVLNTVIIIVLLLYGSRSILFAVIGILGVILYQKVKIFKPIKQLIFTGITLIFIVFIYDNELLYYITTSSGRFFYQLFSNNYFLQNPLGVGLGNYTPSVVNGLWDQSPLDAFSHSTMEYLLKNSSLPSHHSIYPIAESDILLIAGSLGIIGIVLWIILGYSVIWRFVFTETIKNPEKKKGYLIFLFIFFSGIFNDYLYFLPTWFFLGISLNLIRKKINSEN